MDSARIADLLAPFLDSGLSAAQLGQISTYVDLLIRWNSRINLTAIRPPEEIVTRHFGESLFLARHLFHLPAAAGPTTEDPRPRSHPISTVGGHSERSRAVIPVNGPAESKAPCPTTQAEPSPRAQPVRVLDIGSGAGFPALPLKIWEPELNLSLIESNHKKATFLREVCRALTLTDVDVYAERAEALSARLRNADVVTFRAVERFDQVLPLAAKFLSPTGRLAVLIGAAQVPQLESLRLLRWQISDVPQSQARVLAVGSSSRISTKA